MRLVREVPLVPLGATSALVRQVRPVRCIWSRREALAVRRRARRVEYAAKR